MAKTLLAMGFLSANLLHFPHGPAHARRLVEALLGHQLSAVTVVPARTPCYGAAREGK